MRTSPARFWTTTGREIFSLEILDASKRVTQTRNIEFETEELFDADQPGN
jgi:hypothetical protein